MGTALKISFPVQLNTSCNGNFTRLIFTLAICDYHTYMHTNLRDNSYDGESFSDIILYTRPNATKTGQTNSNLMWRFGCIIQCDLRYFQNTNFILIVSEGKEVCTSIVHGDLPAKAAPVTRTILETTGPVPVDSRP